MNYFELRELIESSVPWWTPFVLPVLLVPIIFLFDKRH